MKITSLALQNFRSFGPTPTSIDLAAFTAFVGSNGCGKSSVLQALSRLFGLTQAERTLNRGDFHVPRNQALDETESISLLIEAHIEFPELEGDADPGDAVAECFRHMAVEGPGGTPYCRVRLEGKWTRSNLPEGDIEQELSWVTVAGNEIRPGDKQRMQPHQRSRIHVHYIPAARDPLKQIRQASGSILHRLFRAVNWSQSIIESVETSSATLAAAFRDEPGVTIIREAAARLWRELHPLPIYSDVHLRPLSRRFEDFLAQIEAVFGPAPEGREHGPERLSDGLRSLFYITLIGAIFDIERATPPDAIPVGEEEASHGISRERLNPPMLTVLAVEEPENHLAPHYLGRIMKVLRDMAGAPSGQIVLTSHSASIMARVEPEWVRYLRLDPDTHETLVQPIILPDDPGEAHKFVREAVRAYPELYFAKLVVLGEGPSEEIVLPRIAECFGVPVDASFVSIVPLGGRHVNHFWRLLDGLDIPHVTLLDLDREREGGGYGRIKNVAQQLLDIGHPREEILDVIPENGKPPVLSDEDFAGMYDWVPNPPNILDGWLLKYERFGVFFSAPLDLDFMMQQAFPETYQSTSEGRPHIPVINDPKRAAAIQAAISRVLKEGSKGESYTPDEHLAFFWYRYLFLGRGKPTTHILAMSSLTDEELRAGCPPVLKRLVEMMKDKLRMSLASEPQPVAAEAGDGDQD